MPSPVLLFGLFLDHFQMKGVKGVSNMMNHKAVKLKDIECLMEGRKPGAIGQRKDCAVLIPLVERADGLHFLFEQRSAQMKTQPGDVCFPGGRMEKEETPVACALRETEEEIGISADEIRVIGQFDTIYEVSNLTMNTVIGVISERALDGLILNPAEVDRVFTVPCSFFTEAEPIVYEYDVVQKVEDFPYEKAGIRKDYRWRRGRNSAPIFHYENGDERYIIWGLTARIVMWLLEKLGES